MASKRSGKLQRGLGALALSSLLLAGLGRASAESGAEPTETSMPVFKGKGKVSEPVNTKTGAVFDIGDGITMTFPVGLPVGESRLVTLKRGRNVQPAQVAKGFAPIGPTLEFSGAFRVDDKPMVLRMEQNKAPKAEKGLVLAMEIATFCDDSNKKYKLKGGLCSGWELVDAKYKEGALEAKLESTGGLRMVFGSVPPE